jgi:hypothetical protein
MENPHPQPIYTSSLTSPPIFDGFLCIFNLHFFAVICKFCCIANRLQKSAGEEEVHGTEVCPKGQTLDSAPFHVHLARMLPFQAQQRKVNVLVATAIERRRLQEALAERRVDLRPDSLAACGFPELFGAYRTSTTPRVQAVVGVHRVRRHT